MQISSPVQSGGLRPQVGVLQTERTRQKVTVHDTSQLEHADALHALLLELSFRVPCHRTSVDPVAFGC